jgi:FkbM family methyltransferase
MLPFRVRFAGRRITSLAYYHRLAKLLTHPLTFYVALALKFIPNWSKAPFDLRLKDGKIFRVREFWSLFLFDEIFVENCYESPEVLGLGPFASIIDIGANIGLFVLRSQQLWPEAKVIAVEPHPDNFGHLQEHIAVNQLKNVFPLQIGVAEKCGCSKMYLSPRNIGGHSLYKKNGSSGSITISTSTLADVMSDAKLPNEGNVLLKIDCEGCEYAILSNLTQDIADRISCIVFEPEHSLYDLDDLLVKLQSLGFKPSKISNLVVAAKSTLKAPETPGQATLLRVTESLAGSHRNPIT